MNRCNWVKEILPLASPGRQPNPISEVLYPLNESASSPLI